MDYDSLIVPQAGKEEETARLLLDLADSKKHVRTNSDGPGLTFTVPEYLAKRYQQSGETEVTGVKRRGRPPGSKNTKTQARATETDDKDGEE